MEKYIKYCLLIDCETFSYRYKSSFTKFDQIGSVISKNNSINCFNFDGCAEINLEKPLLSFNKKADEEDKDEFIVSDYTFMHVYYNQKIMQVQ